MTDQEQITVEVVDPVPNSDQNLSSAWVPPIGPSPQGLKSALSTMTIYPVKFPDFRRFSYPASVGWFGWVGACVALPGFLVVMLLQWKFAPSTLALAVFALSAILTRMMHWDGLADVADAWWGGSTPKRRQEIMSDSSTGAFALVTVFIVGLGTFMTLWDVITDKHFLLLIAVPILARIVATYAIRHIDPAKSTGLAAEVTGPLISSNVIAMASALIFALIAVLVSVGILGVIACGVILISGYWIARITSRKMGGLTGDVLGATIILTELLGYCVFLLLSA